MRVLANENLPGPVIKTLRERGYEVLSVKETIPGADDRTVLRLAQKERRLVVTFDKGFGELAFLFGLPSEEGVILFRLSGADPEIDNERVVAALESRSDWEGNFAVVTDNLIHIRPLPRRMQDLSTPKANTES